MEQSLNVHYTRWMRLILIDNRKNRMGNMSDLPYFNVNQDNQIELGEFTRNSMIILIFGITISSLAFLLERVVKLS